MKKEKNNPNILINRIVTPETILVVEDDEGLNRLIQKSLEKNNFQTERAMTGAATITKVVANHNLVLLLDYQLPDMTGKQVIETLNKKNIEVPFIIMTGHGDQKIAVEMMKLGARDYIIKDTNFIEILPQVTKRVVKELAKDKKLAIAIQMLRESEEKFRSLAENINDIIYSSNENGILTYVSPQITRYGLTQDEMILRKISNFIIPEDRKNIDKNRHRIIKHEDEFHTEFRLKDKNGETHWLEEYSKVQKDETGNIIRVNGILRDITKRKHAEGEIIRLNTELEERVKQRTDELEKTYKKLKSTREKIHEAQKRESIGILTRGIASEFNRILTKSTQNLSSIKASMDHEDKNLKLLLKAEQACSDAKNLTRQLFSFSKSGAPIKKTTSVEELIKKSTSLLNMGSKAKLELFIQDNLEPFEIDECQISQVLNNIIDNAEQAMPEGGVIRLRVENICIDKNAEEQNFTINKGNYIKISIEDNGVGIPIENMQKIFDPYYTTKGDGSGLGLATSNSIIKNHGGLITADSTLGRGSTFSIYLPASTNKQELLLSSWAEWKDSIINTQLKKILILDDEEIYNKVISMNLQKLGYIPVVTKNGSQGIELYKNAKWSEEPFEAVIIDLPIPGSWGCKRAIQELIEFDPDVNAIVSSHYSDDPIMIDFMKYGFKGVIEKPYKIDEMGNILGDVIKRKNGYD